MLILAAAGEKAFCVGADLKSLAAEYEAGTRHDPLGLLDLRGLRKAGGAQHSRDRRRSGDTPWEAGWRWSRLRSAGGRRHRQGGFPEATKVGSLPGAGGTQRPTRLAGPGYAKEMMFTGEQFDAAEAWRMGSGQPRGAGRSPPQVVIRDLAKTIATRAPLAGPHQGAGQSGHRRRPGDRSRLESTAHAVLMPARTARKASRHS